MKSTTADRKIQKKTNKSTIPALTVFLLYSPVIKNNQPDIFLEKLTPQNIVNKIKKNSNIAIIEDTLRVFYEPTREGSARIISNIALKTPVDNGTLTYTLKFCENFQFVRGGKLPGLGSKNATTGGNTNKDNQWSVRLMFGSSGQLIIYTYMPNRKTKYGVSYPTNLLLEKGVKYKISISIKTNNTLDKGSITVSVNNKNIITLNDILFRKNFDYESKIHQVLFQTFHGGHDESWSPKATSKNEYPCAEFSDIRFTWFN